MAKKKKLIKAIKIKVSYLSVFALLALPLVILSVFLIYFSGKIYPGVRVDGVLVGGLTPEQAALRLEEMVGVPQHIKITVIGLNGSTETYDIATDAIELLYKHNESSFSAFAVGRSGNIKQDGATIAKAAVGGVDVGLQYSLNHEALRENLELITSVLGNKPEQPKVELLGRNVNIVQGRPGVELESAALYRLIVERIKTGGIHTPIQVQVKMVDPRLSREQMTDVTARAALLAKKSLLVVHEYDTFELLGSELLAMINPTGGYKDAEIAKFSAMVARELERPAQNPVFVFQEGRVSEFSPALSGLWVDRDKLASAIYFKLAELESAEVDQLPMEVQPQVTPPEIDIADVNNLGIQELIGRGTSKFKGSIASRVHNIALASQKLNGTLVKPGEVFSFNEVLGDISVYTGYKQSYIIQGGATILGDGGGVCQVSTTFFRAALDAGLPIVSRKAHAYRVGYYEQDQPAGLDATIYSPTVDLKVKNDTPGYILIQTKPDTKNLTLAIELDGTSDGRVSSVSKPVVYGATPPPEDLYTDDPTLPAGQIKQVDHAAWGAKSAFDYKVVRGEEVLQERTFYSNYQAWQAKFLRGTGPTI